MAYMLHCKCDALLREVFVKMEREISKGKCGTEAKLEGEIKVEKNILK